MKRFEYVQGAEDPLTKEDIAIEGERIARSFEGSDEELRDYLFSEFVKQALVEDFFDALEEHVDAADLDAMQGVLASYPDEEIVSALSLPHELRERMFERFEAELAGGADSVKVMADYIEKVSRYQFGIGFHTSPVDLRPDPETGQWMIKGTEPDHRDGDRMMAYYSTRYAHLFKKRHPKYIYVVRTDPVTHKTDGNWSRADSLSVIMRLPFEKVHSFVEQTVRKGNAPE